MPFKRKVCFKAPHGEKPSVLLVGDLGEYLEMFAGDVLQEADKLQKLIEVCTCDMLPLAGSYDGDKVEVGLIVLLIDVSNKNSLTTARQSLRFIPLDFFLGRLLCVGLNAADESYWSMSPDDVFLFAKECDCPILWGTRECHSSISVLCSQIIRKLELLNTNAIYRSCISLCANRDRDTTNFRENV